MNILRPRVNSILSSGFLPGLLRIPWIRDGEFERWRSHLQRTGNGFCSMGNHGRIIPLLHDSRVVPRKVEQILMLNGKKPLDLRGDISRPSQHFF